MATTSESHLAGAPVYVEGRFLRQICQWCGHRLTDMDLRNVQGSGAEWKPPEWEVGAWVQVDGSSLRVLEGYEGKIPPDSCMRDVSPLLRSVPT
jgi:hypothetical protein